MIQPIARIGHGDRPFPRIVPLPKLPVSERPTLEPRLPDVRACASHAEARPPGERYAPERPTIYLFEREPLVDALPLADRLAYKRRTAILFDRLLRAEQLSLPPAKEIPQFRTAPPCHVIVVDRTEKPAPRHIWHLWPQHPPFADEIRRWWPSDESPPPTPSVVIEDRTPDRPPEVVIMPARSGLFDVWI